MKRSAVIVVALSLAACSRTAVREAPPTFALRTPYQQYADKLHAAGGDPVQAIVPATADDLLKLQTAQRYKFALRSDGRLAIAPLPADAPGADPWVHPVLGLGAPVLTAGYLRADHEGPKLDRVVIDQDSRSYCPTHESSQAAVDALRALGVPTGAIEVQDHPPKCLPQGSDAASMAPTPR
jgi:hypothetical protein